MYKTRLQLKIEHKDVDGIKLYGISADGSAIAEETFISRLQAVKNNRTIDWSETAAFAIFHQGAAQFYLVLCWWGNDNELFTSVSVLVDNEWQEDPARYSFCLYDMELMWLERQVYIDTMDCDSPNLSSYRRCQAI